MRVLIVGAGATGSIMAKLLAQDKEVEQVICGDIDLKRARKFIVPDDKITFKVVDAQKKEDIVALAQGMNMLVNASKPDFNRVLMEAALEVGVNYQDLASSDSGAEEQLAFDQKFKEKNLLGLINASASPGITNLMAGELASKLKRIEYVKVRLLEDVSSDVPFTPWSKEIALEEFSYKPWVWENGEFKTYNSFSEEEIYNFPEPFMNEKCYLVDQEEVETIPLYIKTRNVDVKIGGSEMRSARMFYKLGFMKNKPIKVGGVEVAPYDVLLKIWPDVLGLAAMKKLTESGSLHDAHFWLVVEAKGYRDGGRKKIMRAVVQFPPQTVVNKIYPGANHVSYAAGLSASIFALNLPKTEQKGVFPPEALDKKTRDAIVGALEESGVKIIEVSEAQ